MSTPQTPLRPSLTHSQPVPRHLVHRTAIAEVFPTDSAIVGDGEVLVACQLPVAHRLYNDRAQPFVDPLLILEAARQSSLLCCLRHLGAAANAHFVVRSAELQVRQPLPHAPGAPPWDVLFHCAPSNLRTVDGALVGGHLDLRLHADDRELATVSFIFAALTPESYQSLREPGLQQARTYEPEATPPSSHPLSPGLLGREHADNVVIAEPDPANTQDLPVIVRTEHPSYFDHPLDHVSAAVMVEACRQAAHSACPTPAAECDLATFAAEFTSFAELGVPLTARVGGGLPCDDSNAEFTVELVQFDSVVATVAVGLRSIEADA